MKTHILIISVLLICLVPGACVRTKTQTEEKQSSTGSSGKLIATPYNSGFALAHDTYNGISAASDGNIYYVLCSQSIDTGAQVFSFNPASGKIKHLADLTEVCGEKGLKAIVQGKSHVNFVESGGKLYFASHIGYYSIVDGMETMGVPPPGYKPYPGGHLLSYDMKNGSFEDLGIAPHKEGILTMNMDPQRGLIYGITWPTGYFIRYDVAKKEMKNLGPLTGEGEAGKGPLFRVICRSIAINPDDGTAYMTNSEGTILFCKVGSDTIEKVEGEDMVKDYFGIYDPASPGSMGYNWRRAIWYSPEKKIYGVHGNSGYLFSFDPAIPKVELLDRITSEPSKRSGMFDQFSYGYLGFNLGPDGRTLYYLTGGPIYKDGKRVAGKNSTSMGEAKGQENLHLVSYDIPAGKYKDNGPVFYPDGNRPLNVNSIAIGSDGTVYTLARITENGKTRTDLISIPGPGKE